MSNFLALTLILIAACVNMWFGIGLLAIYVLLHRRT
jgi:hypothetical protein